MHILLLVIYLLFLTLYEVSQKTYIEGKAIKSNTSPSTTGRSVFIVSY
jgi:hypothetical protein